MKGVRVTDQSRRNDRLEKRMDELEEKTGDLSVEERNFSTEETGADSNTKIDALIDIAAEVKRALNRRTAIVAIAIVIPLVVGTFLLFYQVDATRDNHKIAQRAYIQALQNNYDNLISRRQFVLTRDCPVFYLRDLLAASVERRDIREVDPPCEPAEVADIDAQIIDAERKLAEERGK
jgi:hypothetical protein